MTASSALPAPPALVSMTRIVCEVEALVTLGRGPRGERRYVRLRGGTASGPELNGSVVEGGIDWQVLRDDGVLEIAAHYVVRSSDGALIEVRSDGLRHGSADVMAALARGESVPRDAYFFRTLMRFETGAARWSHLNRVMALACGAREARCVTLDVYRIA